MNPFAKKPKVSLTNQILIATVLGLVLGHFIGPAIAPIKVVGDIFLRLIQMSVPIIILGAVTEAVGSINPKDLGKLGFKIALWFLIPTLIAAALRLAIGYIIQPGVGLPAMQLEQTVQPYTQSITTIITNFFPTNIIDSMAKGSMIQVIVFAMMLGVAIIMVVMILFTAAYVQVNPLKLAAKLANMTVVAATTTSSAISLPTKMNDSVNKLGVSERISGLVNPLGMVLNSTGQAMFLSLAAVLIAQFFHIDMLLPQMIQVVMLATLACMGTLAVPGGALVILPGSCRPSACRWKASPSLPASTGSAA